MTGAEHQCLLPHPGRHLDASTFFCAGCGAEYELVYVGLWGIPLRFKRLFQALGRKLRGRR
ncbi:hypothetical protein QFZ75_007948 [Streptomyces sp. V3I8]|uniref:hypothetical protein n=1 Tax=Streptomyces sp. V3I8 TaxID=3042279 RepID=UPI00278AAB7A|nr:hypothetical protein [Streptomyces sp. V3I8]MDQ1041446.1 hypothetical protein [Streptomyces sp. V3I8]